MSDPGIFAKLRWQKRWNKSSVLAAIDPGPDGELFTTCALGSVQIDPVDIPALQNALRLFCDALEGYIPREIECPGTGERWQGARRPICPHCYRAASGITTERVRSEIGRFGRRIGWRGSVPSHLIPVGASEARKVEPAGILTRLERSLNLGAKEAGEDTHALIQELLGLLDSSR